MSAFSKNGALGGTRSSLTGHCGFCGVDEVVCACGGVTPLSLRYWWTSSWLNSSASRSVTVIAPCGHCPRQAPKTVAVCVFDEFGFSIYDLECALNAFRDAFSASVAEVFVYVNYFSFHVSFLLLGIFRLWGRILLRGSLWLRRLGSMFLGWRCRCVFSLLFLVLLCCISAGVLGCGISCFVLVRVLWRVR